MNVLVKRRKEDLTHIREPGMGISVTNGRQEKELGVSTAAMDQCGGRMQLTHWKTADTLSHKGLLKRSC